MYVDLIEPGPHGPTVYVDTPAEAKRRALAYVAKALGDAMVLQGQRPGYATEFWPDGAAVARVDGLEVAIFQPLVSDEPRQRRRAYRDATNVLRGNR